MQSGARSKMMAKKRKVSELTPYQIIVWRVGRLKASICCTLKSSWWVALKRSTARLAGVKANRTAPSRSSRK